MISSNLRIAAYVRVSTEEQASAVEGSIENQKYRLKSFLDIKNNQVKNWGTIFNFYVDDGFSAKDTRRPAYQKMMDDIRKKKIDLILITDLSRLSRNIFDFCGLMDELEKNEAQFLSIKEQFDSTTPAGKMMIYNMINLAQFEREQVSERVALGAHSRAMRGLLNGAKSILGFDKRKGNTGSYVVNECEADQVRTIFRLFLNSGSCNRTIKELDRLGIKPKPYEKQEKVICKDKWSKQTLAYLLTNTAYIGMLEVNKKKKNRDQSKLRSHQQYQMVKASWPAIIGEDDFKKAQALLDQANLHERARLEGADYRFFVASGLLKCAECGHNLIGQTAHGKINQHRYYGHTFKNSKHKCTIQRVHAYEAEKVVLEYIWESIEDAGYLKRIEAKLKKINNVRNLSEARVKKSIQDKLRLIQVKMDNLLLMQSEMSAPALKSVAKTFELLASEKTSIEKQLEHVCLQEDSFDSVKANLEHIRVSLIEIERGYAKANGAMKKRLLRNLVKEVIVSEDGIKIRLYLAFEMSSGAGLIENLLENEKPEPFLKASGDSNLSVVGSSIDKLGEGGANILETSVLSVPVHYAGACKRDTIDLTELARKRWVEKLSMDRIAADMGWGRTAVIAHLGKIRENPDLVEDGEVRLRIYRRKNKFIGQS